MNFDKLTLRFIWAYKYGRKKIRKLLKREATKRDFPVIKTQYKVTKIQIMFY